MIKFLLFLIIGIVIIVFRLFSAAIGTVSLAINKKGTFENFAHQFLKHTTKSKWVLKPYLPQLIDKILKYSDDRNYKIPDILDVLEATLRACVVKISPDDLSNLPQQLHYLPDADGFIIATEFMEENNIKF